MARLSITIDEKTARKLEYVREKIYSDRSVSATANRMIVEHLKRLPEPPAEEEPFLPIDK